jgi:hypothetical protein
MRRQNIGTHAKIYFVKQINKNTRAKEDFLVKFVNKEYSAKLGAL